VGMMTKEFGVKTNRIDTFFPFRVSLLKWKNRQIWVLNGLV